MDVRLTMRPEVGEVYEPLRAQPRLQQHDAAEAQPDLELLHPRGHLGRAPARGSDPSNYLGQSGVMVDRVLGRQ